MYSQMYSLVTKRAKGAQSSMVKVTYSYDHVTRHQKLVERRWILPDSPHRPVFVGSQADYTPFGGSGDTLKRKRVLGGSLRVLFDEGDESLGKGSSDTGPEGWESLEVTSSETSPELERSERQHE